MSRLRFDLVNVFGIAGEPFSGNPLAVITADEPVPDATMQAWARQFNLSETTFVCRVGTPEGVDAAVRIFTPTVELPFAGHPTLGTAYCVAAALGRDAVTLGMPAGHVPVRLTDQGWQLQAPQGPAWEHEASVSEWAKALGLPEAAVPSPAYRVAAGVEQVILELATPEAVRDAVADPTSLRELGLCPSGEALVYLWAWTGAATVEARLFFSQDLAVVEDPATGSACANLGTLWASQGRRNLTVVVSQGAAIHRPSRLVIDLDADGRVSVAGHVVPVGSGSLEHQ